MRIHYLQHVHFEGLAMIGDWAQQRGHTLSSTRFFEADYQLPTMNDIDVLIILGGPMSVNDEAIYPWLNKESQFVKQAIEADKHVLGICLGAQMIAKILGAEVAANAEKEIGWFPIAFSDEMVGRPLLSGLNFAMNVLHWHGERFDIPQGAHLLASSEACSQQGFLYKDKVLGLQFHIEMNQAAIENIISACHDELTEEGQYIQSPDDIVAGAEKYRVEHSLFQLLDNWIRA